MLIILHHQALMEKVQHRAMKDAILEAEINPEEISYINAHGTSTEINDKFETLAIKKAFGVIHIKITVSSTKSMTGHLIRSSWCN